MRRSGWTMWTWMFVLALLLLTTACTASRPPTPTPPPASAGGAAEVAQPPTPTHTATLPPTETPEPTPTPTRTETPTPTSSPTPEPTPIPTLEGPIAETPLELTDMLTERLDILRQNPHLAEQLGFQIIELPPNVPSAYMVEDALYDRWNQGEFLKVLKAPLEQALGQDVFPINSSIMQIYLPNVERVGRFISVREYHHADKSFVYQWDCQERCLELSEWFSTLSEDSKVTHTAYIPVDSHSGYAVADLLSTILDNFPSKRPTVEILEVKDNNDSVVYIVFHTPLQRISIHQGVSSSILQQAKIQTTVFIYKGSVEEALSHILLGPSNPREDASYNTGTKGTIFQ